ncbi:MAG: hypothetical protein MPJ50_12840, partial [Pirellulales bacterium]|nr:hypothetical protein [Pirellulales bacterium]
ANYVPTTTYYAPSSSCCTTTNYAPSQTCNYVPTTTYRQQVVSTPVTGYRAITRYNWLTGWPVTRYRPVTTYVQHVQYQPTTSYRLQCTPNYVAPATSYPSTTPTTQPGDTAAPSMAPGTATPQNTFRPETDANGTTGQPTRALKPIPDANTDGASDAVETGDDGSSLLLQNPNNHTAQASTGWRIRTAVSHEDELRPRVIPAVDSNPVNANAVKKPVISSDGWRAAKKK